ncbi:hypothetical protein [Kocuria tytonis]|uniref:hypothetical protein n=1 Tax=Kocuria tytonis TaxID=2054280 RepID=UPI001F2219F4|nr:hypothetical protein [Kocuria tytonis]
MSLAHRMLAGAGRASVVAYRVPGQPVLSAVAHGLTRRGELVLAATVDPAIVPEDALVTGEPVDVRMDITKVAPEPDVRIVAASAHLLARLEWLDPLDAELLVGTGEVPELLAGVAAAPGGRLAVLDAPRVLLHDGSGVTPLDYGGILTHHLRGAGSGDLAQDVEAAGFDAVMDVDRLDLASVCDAAEQGWIPAHLLTQKPSAGGCAHTTGRDFVVDVDATGVTVLRYGARLTSVYFVPFSGERTAPADLGANLQHLLGARVAA